jgi:protein-S-isoprenylcysteine O-methyltransferase Ste14
MRALELKVPPALLVLLIGLAMHRVADGVPRGRFAFPGQGMLAALLLLAGLAAALLGVLRFRSAGTTVDPVHPDRSSALVVSGIYRRTRNPMYLGFLLALAAWGARLGSLPALLGPPLFALYMDRFQIRPEERALEARFGEEYRAYRARVRRWF